MEDNHGSNQKENLNEDLNHCNPSYQEAQLDTNEIEIADNKNDEEPASPTLPADPSSGNDEDWNLIYAYTVTHNFINCVSANEYIWLL